MNFNFITNIKTCSDFIANSNPVSLILYTHIPSGLIALFVGGFVLTKNRTLLGKILFGITFFFSVWAAIDLVVWLSTNSIVTMAAWALFGLLTALISIMTFHFFYVFLFKRDLSVIKKIIIFLPLIPVVVLTPTIWNVSHFNIVSCEAIDNIYFDTYYYIIGVAAMMGILWLMISSFRKKIEVSKKEMVLMFFGLELFLVSFLSLGYLSSYFDNYSIEFYGLFGMVIFMIFLAYLVVKFKEFNIKLLSTQVLVWALVILIGAEFLFIQSQVNQILTAVTLVISGWLGLIIIRSVKKEVAQREKIEKLASDLEKANMRLQELDKLKSEFVSLATHQIRSPLSAIKGYLSEVFEGDFGPVTPELDKPLRVVYQSTENLVQIVGDFLNISRIEQGTMKYEISNFDLKTVAQTVINELKPNVNRAGLKLEFDAPETAYQVKGDIGKIKQVVSNLIDNSLKYTPHGSIKVALSFNPQTRKVRLAVRDTGIGIDPRVIPKLFQKFVRAEGANEVNIIGTGLGLYVAKLMVEGQQGTIWAESQGKDKGSQFYVELPMA